MNRIHRRAQAGLTLVELLVALLIGLFLLGGLMTLVQDNRRSFASQNQLSQLQDNERLAMTIISDVIQAAGYFPNPTLNTASSAIPAVGTLAAGQPLAGTYNGTAPGDSITVQYATNSGDGILNCSGNSNTSGGVVAYSNVFSVVNGQLQCALTSTPGGTVTYPLVGTATGVGDGIIVYNLSILYGIGAGNNVTEYVNATGVTNWSNVVSMQVSLTFQNPLWSATNIGQGTQPQYLTVQRVVDVMNQTGI
jgi:type IV pilus assembly protein PilW